MKSCMNYYGEMKYVYYYKGHPKDKSVIEDKKERF